MGTGSNSSKLKKKKNQVIENLDIGRYREKTNIYIMIIYINTDNTYIKEIDF